MSKATLHIIVESPFEKRDYDRFAIEALRSRGIQIKIWDISPLLNLKRFEDTVAVNGLHVVDGYTALKNRAKALSLFSKMKSDDVVLFIAGLRFKSYPYYLALSKSGAKVGSLFLGMLPVSFAKRDVAAKQKRSFNIVRKAFSAVKSPRKVTDRLWAKFQAARPGLRPLDYALVAGTPLINPIGVDSKTTILKTHSLDFENYLGLKDKVVPKESDFIVYLDECIPFHPDYAHLGLEPPCEPDDYFSQICRFFDQIEKKTGKRVVIAAHPRSGPFYKDARKLFQGREVVYGKTVELVKNAGFVLAHASTALSYVALFRKPVLFLNASFLRPEIEGWGVECMSKAFGKKPFNLDSAFEKLDLDSELQISEPNYQKYVDIYLRHPESKMQSLWMTFADYLDTLS